MKAAESRIIELSLPSPLITVGKKVCCCANAVHVDYNRNLRLRFGLDQQYFNLCHQTESNNCNNCSTASLSHLSL